MGNFHFREINELKRLCEEHEEESLALEFKSCNELKSGTEYYKDSIKTIRSIDDVKEELSKDVSSFLNSAGGTIIYGIREKNSRAADLDETNAFRQEHRHNIDPERVNEWIRSHVKPPPTVQVHSILLEPNDPEGPWVLVVKIPQGEQAYMAKDHKFYKRVSNVRKPMEQYEVADVMNRTRGAALLLDMTISGEWHETADKRSATFGLRVAITSTNLVASEYGALKLTVAWPLAFASNHVWKGADYDDSEGLYLEGYSETAHAQSVRARWGANHGQVIFPEDWFDFHGNGFRLQMPHPNVFPDFTYVIEARLFTRNRRSIRYVHFVQDVVQNGRPTGQLALVGADQSNYSELAGQYWDTCHRWVKTRQGFSNKLDFM